MSISRYREYKDSGLPGLGQVPAHWSVLPLKRIAGLKSGESITAEDIDESGPYPVFGGNGLRGYTTSFTHSGTYALVGRQGALCGNVNYAEGPFWASEHAVVVTPKVKLATRWLGELLRAMDLNRLAISAAQPGLSVEVVANLRIPVPPSPEQDAIAAFLDRETVRIDALIEKKRRLIELLQEKRAAVITKAVTRGLDAGAALRATGVPWFDWVPAHWTIKRLRYLTPNVTVGIVVTPSKYYEDEGVPALRSFNVKPGTIDGEGLAFISEASNQELAKSKLREGDLVSVRTGNPGTTAVVPSEYHGANCIDLIITRRSTRFDSRFLCFFMNSTPARVQFEHGSGGALQQHFNIETAKNLVVPTPPIDEQIRIADHLERRTEALDRLRNFVNDAIARLQEHRSAVVAAAVTGQIDVREAA